jgi:hypothetical protein
MSKYTETEQSAYNIGFKIGQTSAKTSLEYKEVSKAKWSKAFRMQIQELLEINSEVERERDQYKAQAEALAEALTILHDDIAEYAAINSLGGFQNHAMKQARATLAQYKTMKEPRKARSARHAVSDTGERTGGVNDHLEEQEHRYNSRDEGRADGPCDSESYAERNR